MQSPWDRIVGMPWGKPTRRLDHAPAPLSPQRWFINSHWINSRWCKCGMIGPCSVRAPWLGSRSGLLVSMAVILSLITLHS